MEPKTSIEDNNTPDNDAGERPVRRKLKETSIHSGPRSFTEGHTAGSSADNERKSDDDSRSSSRGRKRSFDDSGTGDKTEGAENENGSGDRRKRSRESTAENDNLTTPVESGKAEGGGISTPPKQPQGVDGGSGNIMSPKKKRSRDQLDKGQSEEHDGAKLAEERPPAESVRDEGEPETKRHRDSSQEGESTAKPKTSITSAFSNTSTASPFASLAAKSSDTKEKDSSKKDLSTSSSAFASSSLAAFADSEQSPFSSLGNSTTSIFKSTSSTSEPGKPAPTGFAAAAGPSPFATTAASSGFGTLGSGFAGFSSTVPKTGQTGGLTSFASPGGPGILGTSKPKPLGAAADEEEEKEAEAGSTTNEFGREKPDERFQKQHVETGEEEEKAYFACKGKLFQFSDKQWRERGIGTFKINVKEPNEEKGTKKTARMIMRADGVLRVMLNAPLFKGLAVGDLDGGEPKNKQIHLASVENGRSVPYLLRTGNEEVTRQLYHAICRLQEEL